MKKLIALPVVLALIAGASFAVETGVNGYYAGGATVAEGTTDDGSEIGAKGLHFGRLQVKVQNDEGTFGGIVRVNAGSLAGYGYSPDAFAWGWWQPVEQVRLQIGRNPDGDFATNFIVGWGYHAGDAEDLVALYGYGNLARSKVFYAGFDVAGLELTIKPAPAFAINVAVPYERGGTAEDIYTHTHAQLVYDVGIGEIAVTFTGGKQNMTGGEKKWQFDNDTGKYEQDGTTSAGIDTSSFYGQFYLKKLMEEKLQINIGVKYSLPVEGGGGGGRNNLLLAACRRVWC